MEHIAIDLGGRQSQICVRASDGQIILQRRQATSELAEFVAKRPPSRVIVEACAEAFLGVGAHGVKSDRRDADALSLASCRIDLPSVHIPSRQSRERKSRCGMHDALVRSRTLLINNVRGYLRATVRRPKPGDTATFTARVRALIGIERPSAVEALLSSIDAITAQLKLVDRELAAEARRDPVCRRLMTVPGVGWVTALRFAATLDDIARFGDAQRVASYLGMVPGERSSGDRQRRTGITKAGSTPMRWLLVQAAWASRRVRRKDAMHRWADELEKRRGKRVAVMALARKLAGILFAIWRDGTTYRHDAV